MSDRRDQYLESLFSGVDSIEASRRQTTVRFDACTACGRRFSISAGLVKSGAPLWDRCERCRPTRRQALAAARVGEL